MAPEIRAFRHSAKRGTMVVLYGNSPWLSFDSDADTAYKLRTNGSAFFFLRQEKRGGERRKVL